MGDNERNESQESQERRGRHREQSPKVLEAAGVSFVSKNFGIHLIVKADKGYIDFWPGTGKWIARNDQKKGRGVFNLIKYMKNQEERIKNGRNNT